MSKKLTIDFILFRVKNSRLDQVKTLNLWGSDLGDISILSDLPALEIVSLSVNKISSLSAFSKMKNLRELYLRKNIISDFKEIEELRNCTNLRTLSLIENPITEVPNYRNKILEILPQLTKLDDIPVGATTESNPPSQTKIDKKPSKEIKKQNSNVKKKKTDFLDDMDNSKNPFNNNIQNEANTNENDINKDNDNTSSHHQSQQNIIKERPIRQKAGGFKKFCTENNINPRGKKEQDFQLVEKKSSKNNINNNVNHNNNSDSNDKGPGLSLNELENDEQKETQKVHAHPQTNKNVNLQMRNSYLRPTLNKSLNFENYQTEDSHSKQQYRKKIIGKFNFANIQANNENENSGSKTNRLTQSQFNKPSLRYEDEEENFEQHNNHSDIKQQQKIEDINSFPIKEVNEEEQNMKSSSENNSEAVIRSIKLLLTTLNESGLKEIKNEITKMLSK